MKLNEFKHFEIVNVDDCLYLRVDLVDLEGIFNLDNSFDIPILDILLKLCALHYSCGVNKFEKRI